VTVINTDKELETRTDEHRGSRQTTKAVQRGKIDTTRIMMVRYGAFHGR